MKTSVQKTLNSDDIARFDNRTAEFLVNIFVPHFLGKFTKEKARKIGV